MSLLLTSKLSKLLIKKYTWHRNAHLQNQFAPCKLNGSKVTSWELHGLHGNSMNNNSNNVSARKDILQRLEQSDSMNKNLPSRGIGISDECVYDQNLYSRNPELVVQCPLLHWMPFRFKCSRFKENQTSVYLKINTGWHCKPLGISIFQSHA